MPTHDRILPTIHMRLLHRRAGIGSHCGAGAIASLKTLERGLVDCAQVDWRFVELVSRGVHDQQRIAVDPTVCPPATPAGRSVRSTLVKLDVTVVVWAGESFGWLGCL